MSTVLFLGAGFSRPFGQPTMNEFLQYARGVLSEEDQGFLFALMADAAQANRMLESSPTNLEDILSFAVMGDRLRLFEEGEEPRARKLKEIIRSIYSHVPPEKVAGYFGSFQHHLDNFLGYTETRNFLDLSIITTNYDLNIESWLYQKHLRALLPFEYQQGLKGQLPRFCLAKKQTGTIPLFKLHGSVNWFNNESKEGAELIVVDDIANVQPPGTRLPRACTRNFEPPGDPVIIPPTFIKPDLSGTLSEIWAGAAHALQKADTIIFIGYSFPSSDVEMKYFLARSLMDNFQLHRIIISDLRATAIVERLQSESFGSHFKSFLIPADGNWKTSRLTKHDWYKP